MGSLTGKVVLVTGASRGIGFAAAVEAARRGAAIVAVARTTGGLEELDDAIKAAGSSAALVPLDLTDGAAIDRLGGVVFERWGRLDGLIGNAGQLGTLSPLPHAAPDEFTKIMAINVIANFRLIRAFDLLLRQADAGRAVFVSSGAARSSRPYWGLYSASKAALESLVKTYAAETAQTAVRVNAFDPGAVRTRMRAKAVPGEDPETLPTAASIVGGLVDMIEPGFGQTGMRLERRTGALVAL